MLEEHVAEMDKNPNQPNFKLEADFVENPKHSSEQPVNHNSGVWIKPELNIKEEPLDERDMEISEACNVGLYVREEESIAAKSKCTSCKVRWNNTRGNYRKSLKEPSTISGQSAKKIKLCKHSEQLRFLKKYIDKSETTGNIASQHDEENSLDNDEQQHKDQEENIADNTGEPTVPDVGILEDLQAQPSSSSKPTFEAPGKSSAEKSGKKKATPQQTPSAKSMEYLICKQENQTVSTSPHPVNPFLAATDIQWKGKSLRNSFRRELAIIKKEKPGSAQERLRKESVYFKQLSYLLPICKTRPHENEAAEDPTEGRNTEKESQPQDPSTHQKKRKKPLLSDEQVLFQALAKKVNTPDDPEKQFLLCLLPYFKSIPESAKLDVKVEFMNILKRYKNLPTLVNQQYFPPPHDLFPGPSSSVSYTPHNLAPDIMPSQSTASQRQKVPSSTPSPAPSATSQALSPWSDSSSICDEY